MMNRRTFLAAGLGPLVATAMPPSRAPAQAAPRPGRIGVLSWYSPGSRADEFFESHFAELGLAPGRDFQIEYRYAGGNRATAREHARAFVAEGVDVIVAVATPAAQVVKAETGTIPVVFQSADPLQSGLVTSLSRPDANLTGISTFSTDIIGKRLEILREIRPDLASAAFIGSSIDPNGAVFARHIAEAGANLKIATRAFLVPGAEAFPEVFRAITADGQGAVLFQPLFLEFRAALSKMALAGGLISAGDQREFAEAGTLFAYGPNRRAFQRRMASMIVKILRGARPGDLPIEQPTLFDLVINLSTARALGLTLPPSVLLRADEVIE